MKRKLLQRFWRYFFCFLPLLCFEARANSVEIKFDPARPVIGESFNIIFNVNVSKDTEKDPYISFDLSRGEVQSKQLAGKTTNATVINGRFQLSKTFRYVYEVISDRSGVLTVKNIEVDLGGKVLKPARKTVKIYSKRQKPKEFFLQAEISKTKAYIGEGLDLRYYLYSRIPVSPLEIEIFPKLKGFIKRFHMPDNRRETVEIDGVVYSRAIQYSARIYPEKDGLLRIDPLKLKVQYSDRRSGSPFGNLGFSFGRRKNKSLRSKDMKVEILPIPTEGLPPNFTGLIGDHVFKFSINKSKFLVNEVIEIKLSVEGPGALEKLDIPQILKHPEIESFDVKAELNEIGKTRAIKTFEFTYLPRRNLEIPANGFKFHLFDPETGTFLTKEIQIPAISVKGGTTAAIDLDANNSSESLNTPKDNTRNDNSGVAKIISKIKYIAPSFDESDESNNFSKVNIAIILMSLFILTILVSMLKGLKIFRKYPESVVAAYDEIQKSGPSFKNLSRFVRTLNKEIPVHLPLKEQVDQLDISDSAKNYFVQCIAQSEKKTYGKNKNKNQVKLEKKYFKEALSLTEIKH